MQEFQGIFDFSLDHTRRRSSRLSHSGGQSGVASPGPSAAPKRPSSRTGKSSKASRDVSAEAGGSESGGAEGAIKPELAVGESPELARPSDVPAGESPELTRSFDALGGTSAPSLDAPLKTALLAGALAPSALAPPPSASATAPASPIASVASPCASKTSSHQLGVSTPRAMLRDIGPLSTPSGGSAPSMRGGEGEPADRRASFASSSDVARRLLGVGRATGSTFAGATPERVSANAIKSDLASVLLSGSSPEPARSSGHSRAGSGKCEGSALPVLETPPLAGGKTVAQAPSPRASVGSRASGKEAHVQEGARAAGKDARASSSVSGGVASSLARATASASTGSGLTLGAPPTPHHELPGSDAHGTTLSSLEAMLEGGGDSHRRLSLVPPPLPAQLSLEGRRLSVCGGGEAKADAERRLSFGGESGWVGEREVTKTSGKGSKVGEAAEGSKPAEPTEAASAPQRPLASPKPSRPSRPSRAEGELDAADAALETPSKRRRRMDIEAAEPADSCGGLVSGTQRRYLCDVTNVQPTRLDAAFSEEDEEEKETKGHGAVVERAAAEPEGDSALVALAGLASAPAAVAAPSASPCSSVAVSHLTWGSAQSAAVEAMRMLGGDTDASKRSEPGLEGVATRCPGPSAREGARLEADKENRDGNARTTDGTCTRKKLLEMRTEEAAAGETEAARTTAAIDARKSSVGEEDAVAALAGKAQAASSDLEVALKDTEDVADVAGRAASGPLVAPDALPQMSVPITTVPSRGAISESVPELVASIEAAVPLLAARPALAKVAEATGPPARLLVAKRASVELAPARVSALEALSRSFHARERHLLRCLERFVGGGARDE